MTRWGYLSLALLLAAFLGAAYAHVNADRIPGDRIPIHWNIHGQADDWVGKDQPFLAFYLLPVIMGGVVALGLFAYEHAPKAIRGRRAAVEASKREVDQTT